MNTKEILVLFSRKNRQVATHERIFTALKQTSAQQGRALSFTRSTLDELLIQVRSNALVVTDTVTGKELKQFDYVDFNWWEKAKQQALAAATYLNRHAIPFMNRSIVNLEASSKIGEMALMADSDISLPDTFISSGGQVLSVFRQNPPFPFPLIVKDADACGGKRNYLVDSYERLKEVIAENPDVDFLIQEFIPNDFDYRCLVIGSEIKVVIQRARNANADTHLNNTSAGGVGTTVPLDSIAADAQAMVLRAARSLGREQLCGVDLIIDKQTGMPYILEVNQPPEIELGAEPEKKTTALLDYIEADIHKS